ncbi:MAG: hypothetical protein K2W95_15530 [Candidatus Obscuribacterales bacterium]|nr:hypothetical protein [Candidatus Obscuribacterales bacterium]
MPKAKAAEPVERTTQIILAMQELAEEWQTITKGSAFFMLITDSGASVQMSTKNWTKKQIKVG